MGKIKTDHINWEFIEDKYTHEEIMSRGQHIIRNGSDGVRRSCHLSSYDVAYEGEDFLSGTPEEVKEMLWKPFQEKINEMVGHIRADRSERKFEDTVTVTVSQDPTEECFELRVFVPFKNDLETAYYKGIQFLIAKEAQDYVAKETARLNEERKRKRDESDLKRLIRQNPELAEKLLTGDKS